VREAFHPLITTWFADRFGAPTSAQARGWPAIAQGADTLIAAPTGSGKTLAAFLVGLDDLLRRGLGGDLPDTSVVVYVSPLRALANDIQVNLTGPLAELRERAASAGTPLPEIRVGVRNADTTARARAAQARRPPHVMVTTPESLYILLTTASGRRALAGARTVIVDEIHALVGDRRGSHLALSLERLDALVARERPGAARPQRIGLSATQRPLALVAEFLSGGAPCTVVDEGHRRDLDLAVGAPDGELAAVASHEQWESVYDQVAALAGAHRSTIVFANTRRLVERTAAQLGRRLGEDAVAAHHGALAQDRRLGAEQRLKHGQIKVIVATSSLELGIDVGAVDLVIQLGSPRSIRGFLQRVGRAGHGVGRTPKGRLFALTRDDLVECAALTRAVGAGRLDALCLGPAALDVLAQQLVAACVGHDWHEDALYELIRRARPYRDLERARFDQVLAMLADGVSTRIGRVSAHLHHDQVNRRVRARRAARLTAIRSGGAIPDRADYDVILDPDGIKVGTLDEDYAIESSAGDIFQLGASSWRIRRVEGGRVRVEDARGAPPSVPFWLGEGLGRTAELSEEVARLREDVAARVGDGGAAATWLEAELGLARPLGVQLHDYVAATVAALGAVPTQRRIIAERFFDEGGGMQLVIHAPFGARLNRAWGLALRKKFCRTFDFELQAAATDDGIILSLSAVHSFPLETIFHYVPSGAVRATLTQAALQAPMWGVRWRWNATRALAIPRFTSRGKLPAPLLRIRAEDLLAAVFPAQLGCQDNHGGVMREAIELPDHPLVAQTLGDCLDEAMDTDGLAALLGRLERGELELVARDTAEPSPMCHQILNANPYAFLDDAPLEERRTRAVSVRRGLPADVQRELGALDPAAIAEVGENAFPVVRDADELHDALLSLGALPLGRAEPAWAAHFETLAGAGRATSVTTSWGAHFWVAAERLDVATAAWGPLELAPPLPAAPARPAAIEPAHAQTLLVRGWLEHTGPHTEAELGAILALSVAAVAAACAALESDGVILRGTFSATGRAGGSTEWCNRRLLARIHRATLGRLRREIDPVPPAVFARFVRTWQHTVPGTRLHGPDGLEAILDQLQGIEAPVAAWERDLLPARIEGYRPELLDELCLSGELVWGRRSASEAQITTRATPIAFWRRGATPWMLGARAAAHAGAASAGAAPTFEVAPGHQRDAAEAVIAVLAARGALFYSELLEATGLLRQALDGALWALVAAGRITADGFAALRTLANESPRRTGRWSLLGAGVTPAAADVAAEAHARHLLARWGVVLRELAVRELVPPWRELLVVLRRLEARGEVRGGRFVAGFVGEQFALPEAVDALRALRPRLAGGDGAPDLPPLAPRDPAGLAELVAPRPVLVPQAATRTDRTDHADRADRADAAATP
jgi:ATP-dependent Lhr-like helicase